MTHRFDTCWIALVLLCCLGVSSVLAHITPPVVLLSEQDAVREMTGGATKFFVREARLTAEERDAVFLRTDCRQPHAAGRDPL